MLLEYKMERPGPSSKRAMPMGATAGLLRCKKGTVPAAANGCTGDTNGHPQGSPQMPMV